MKPFILHDIIWMIENINAVLSLLREKTISRLVPCKCLSDKMMPEVIVYNAVSIDGRLDHCGISTFVENVWISGQDEDRGHRFRQ